MLGPDRHPCRDCSAHLVIDKGRTLWLGNRQRHDRYRDHLHYLGEQVLVPGLLATHLAVMEGPVRALVGVKCQVPGDWLHRIVPSDWYQPPRISRCQDAPTLFDLHAEPAPSREIIDSRSTKGPTTTATERANRNRSSGTTSCYQSLGTCQVSYTYNTELQKQKPFLYVCMQYCRYCA